MTARSKMGLCLACLAMVGLTAAQGGERPTGIMTLIADGRPISTIVVPADATSVATSAAGELRHYLQESTGAMVPIKRENELAADEKQGHLILVGAGQLARQEGVDVATLKPEGFIIRATSNRLILAGPEDPVGTKQRQQGTYFAVVTFLERHLGVRWLWPGKLGEVVPRQRTLGVAPIDYRDAPALRQRKIRDALTNSNPRKWGKGKDFMQMDDRLYGEMIAQSSRWMGHQRLGRSIELNCHHGFQEWWEEYHQSHPEFFALQGNGSREWPAALGSTGRAKMCVGNLALLDTYMKKAEAFFKTDPYATSYSASPNDNAFNGHCTCPLCTAWDAMDGPKVTLTTVDRQGKRVQYESPALTDRYVHFYNLAAERLAKIAPGKFIGGYAYGAWRTPPVHEKVRDNVIIGFVGFNSLDDEGWEEHRKFWDAWAKAAPHLFLRPNLLNRGEAYPLVYVHRLGETLRHCGETGMMGADFDTLRHHWASQGLNYYVLARLLWNPRADVDALVDDYCRSGFGAAAPAVQRYFEAVEAHTRLIGATAAGDRKGFGEETLSLHTPEVFQRLQKPLDEARRLAGADSLVQQCIAFLAEGLQYARLRSEALRVAFKKGRPSDAQRQAFQALDQFYRDNRYSFAIGVPSVAYEQEKQIRRVLGRQ